MSLSPTFNVDITWCIAGGGINASIKKRRSSRRIKSFDSWREAKHFRNRLAKLTLKVSSPRAVRNLALLDDCDVVYIAGASLASGCPESVAGFGVYFGNDDDDERNVSTKGVLGQHHSIESMTLTALIHTLSITGIRLRPLEIHTDSLLVAYGFNTWIDSPKQRDWSKVQHGMLWAQIEALVKKGGGQVTVVKEAGPRVDVKMSIAQAMAAAAAAASRRMHGE